MPFANKRTAAIFAAKQVKRIDTHLQNRALRKLTQLDAATILDDMRTPPSNHLEKLSGTRDGQYSIRVNQQWRICFEWRDGHTYNVDFLDYH